MYNRLQIHSRTLSVSIWIIRDGLDPVGGLTAQIKRCNTEHEKLQLGRLLDVEPCVPGATRGDFLVYLAVEVFRVIVLSLPRFYFTLDLRNMSSSDTGSTLHLCMSVSQCRQALGEAANSERETPVPAASCPTFVSLLLSMPVQLSPSLHPISSPWK